MTTTGVARRGVLVAEVAVLVVTTVVDTVLIARTDGRSGLAEVVLVSLVPYVGIAVAVLAVLRRRFPRHVELIGYAVVGFSLLTTAGSAVWDQAWAQPVAAETVAAVLLAGAVCRRLSPVRAVTLASTAGAR